MNRMSGDVRKKLLIVMSYIFLAAAIINIFIGKVFFICLIFFLLLQMIYRHHYTESE